MPSTRVVLKHGLTLEARRAAIFPDAGVLAVADLHLGYAWTQRTRGALLPVGVPDSTLKRLAELVADYAPRRVAVLGDIVHQALSLPALKTLLQEFCAGLGDIELVFCPGNHDRRLDQLVRDWKLPVTLVPELQVGRHRLWHGDGAAVPPGTADFTLEGDGAVQVIGHEHPALELGDGVATQTRAPCFLVADEVIVLPAFSDWAAGCVVGRRPFLGETARGARFHTAYACLGPRLLRVPLSRNHSEQPRMKTK